MKSEPRAPGAAAVYLFRQIDRDDVEGRETVYVQIKILTDEGRQYGDVEISYDQGDEFVRSIEARTIRPDGSIAKFDGRIYEKPIVRSQGVRLMAKTFTVPEVQVGSVVEYRYLRGMSSNYVYDSQWLLSAELFTRQAKFSLLPSGYFPLQWSWPLGLPEGASPPRKESGRVRLETGAIPAFVREEFMPPENEMKLRVNFVYVSDELADKNPEVFWRKLGKQRFGRVKSFVAADRVMKEAVATIIAPDDGPATKLRKIYLKTQALRNTSYERDKTGEELRREKQRSAGDVADVWKQGYGDAFEVTWLFLALVRAAGIEAHPVLLSTRDRYFFNSGLMNAQALNSNLVVVKLDGKDLYLDPGVAFTPYGLLPWSETGVKGLKLDKSGGVWVTTPLPQPGESRVLRAGALRLSSSGTLEGTVKVTYTGLEAQWRRMSMRNEDAENRKEFLENGLEGDIPTGADVTLSNTPEWTRSDLDLVAEFEVRVPGWATNAGQRALLPMGVFGNAEKGLFKAANRVHPLYFTFPNQQLDDVSIVLPEGWRVTSMPKARSAVLAQIAYRTSAQEQAGTLRLTRDLVRNMIITPASAYHAIRTFYQGVQTGDGEQIVITRAAAHGVR